MTDVRAPETDPFDPAAERDDQPRPGSASPAGGAYGLAGWLKWAWRQLTSMRIALVLLFLLALGFAKGIYDQFAHPLHFAANTILIFVSGLIIGSLALLADLIVRSRGDT